MVAGDGCVAEYNGLTGFKAAGGSMTLGDNCQAVRGGRVGFLACAGGRLTTGDGCTAEYNKEAGFEAFGGGTYMQVGDHSSAMYNQQHGYNCQGGALLTVGDHCIACHNRGSGFRCICDNSFFACASEAPSLLLVGKRSTSKNGGSQGYYVHGKGQMIIQEGSTAEGNEGSGFCTGGDGPRLVVGPECTSRDNMVKDFSRRGGGQLIQV
jgi:hypothetical protein